MAGETQARATFESGAQGRVRGSLLRDVLRVFACTALTVPVACSSGHGAESTQSGGAKENSKDASGLAAPADANALTSLDATTISCANDPRGETYAPDLTAPGNAGLLTFVLASATPAPPALGAANVWTLKITDASGAPVPHATFSRIRTWMPDHGHGSPLDVVATSNGDGTYAITSLDFFMTGLWQVTFFADVLVGTDAATESDSATFSFCVGG
jgi:hypothetical protein